MNFDWNIFNHLTIFNRCRVFSTPHVGFSRLKELLRGVISASEIKMNFQKNNKKKTAIEAGAENVRFWSLFYFHSNTRCISWPLTAKCEWVTVLIQSCPDLLFSLALVSPRKCDRARYFSATSDQPVFLNRKQSLIVLCLLYCANRSFALEIKIWDILTRSYASLRPSLEEHHFYCIYRAAVFSNTVLNNRSFS